MTRQSITEEQRTEQTRDGTHDGKVCGKVDPHDLGTYVLNPDPGGTTRVQ